MKNLKFITLAILVMLFSFSCTEEQVLNEISVSEEIAFHDAYDPYYPEEGDDEAARATRNASLALGKPSGATTSTSRYWDYLIKRNQYAMSYHRDRGVPNWVSWHLSTAWLGSASRTSSFYVDQSLPSGWNRISTSDYTNSGFDRGHNCPSADRTTSSTYNKSTFYMTNIAPQAPNLNQRAWKNLEDYCRQLVRNGKELYIICGSYGTGGSGRNGSKSKIAGGEVTVPSRFWKVIVVLNNGTNDVSRVKNSTRVIAVDMPNNQSVGSNWGQYRTTVDAIEQKRGYNLLSSVPSAIQSVIESRKDNGPTS